MSELQALWPVTCAAKSAALVLPCVGGGVLVSLRAVRLSGVDRCETKAAKDICSVCNGLDVAWPDAALHATQMIQIKAIWNLSNDLGESQSVSQSPDTACAKAAVSVLPRHCPNPTATKWTIRAIEVDARQESEAPANGQDVGELLRRESLAPVVGVE